MFTQLRNHYPALSVAAAVVLAAFGCSGGGGGGGGGRVEDAGVVPQVDGNWSTTASCDERACGDGTPSHSEEITVTQNGEEVTVFNGNGEFHGSIDSKGIVEWSGTYPEDGGTTTLRGSWRVRVDSNNQGVSFTGESSWQWSDGFDSCSGSCTYNGTRTPPVVTSTAPNIAGAWRDTEECESDCESGVNVETIMIEQDGDRITVHNSHGVFRGTITARTVSWSGSFAEDGGTTQTSGTWTLGPDNNTYTGKSTWTWSDGSEICRGSCRYSGERL